MKKFFGLMLLAGVMALGYWGFTVFFPSPRQLIAKRLNQVARLVSFSANEGEISRLAKVERLGQFFTTDVQVMVDIPGYRSENFNGRDEMMQVALAAKHLGNGLKAEFLDMNIEMGIGSQSALVDLTLKAKATGESDMIWQELKLTLKKVGADWLITRVETVPTLKP